MRDMSDLENFFSAYFHQDWSIDHDTAEAVVAYYRESESEQTVAGAREQLSALLAQDLDEDELAEKVQSLGCEYDPTGDGGSYRDWLTGLAQSLS